MNSARMLRRVFAACLAALILPGAAPAVAPLTPAYAFGSTPPWGAQPSHIVWAPDASSFLYERESQNAFAVLPVRQYDVSTGQSRVVIDPKKYGAHAKTPADLVWSPHGKRLAFVEQGILYVRDMQTNLDRKIAAHASGEQWSPSGNALAYVSRDDLYAAYLTPDLHIVRLTKGGKRNTILNGSLDWVYPEELGTEHGFAWSPDGRTIAYMQMDERPVTRFPIQDYIPIDNTVSYQRYPLAGEKNPLVTLHVVSAHGSGDRVVYDAGARDEYLPFFGWRPHSDVLIAETLDRAQQHLRVLEWPGAKGKPKTLYAQYDSKWVGAVEGNGDVPLPTWLPGGASLWMLDRGGVTGLYLRSASGALKRLTGDFRSFALLGVDPKRQTAYVTAAYPTRRDRCLLAIPLTGGAPRNLTPAAGVHRVSLAPTGALFVDTHSTLNDPPQSDLTMSSNGEVRATLAAENAQLRSELLPVQMLSVASSYGPLDAWMLKPPDFDPSRKYPVIIYVYGGPTAPTTANGFDGEFALYHQMLAREGFIVFSIDGPASQVDSDAHVQLLYHNFGPGSLLGQKIGVQYLRSLPYVDASRIGIWGWSFGGYETIYALTHTKDFKAGAAVAPVTDWHFYDTIYTERYMGAPQNDPAAYDRSSDIKAAANLHGDLLISHGTSDDNVHLANTISMLQAFIKAGKTNVDLYLYPRRTHSIAGVPQRTHLFEHMLAWWVRHL